ncbi:MAG: hypothetical protein K0U54_13760 [Bacteroidetes bacterium]|nr:hypothetical protein [Bacteroidota bacterium]
MSFRTVFIFSIAFVVLLSSCSKSDEPNNDSTEVTITASNITLNIDENPQRGDILGEVQASTSSGNISFSILDQTPSGAIAVGANSGVITVANAFAFNYEVNPLLSGTIRLTNGNVIRDISFSIALVDVEETLTCSDNIFLANQEDVDAFGASGCTIIEGSLAIGNYFDPNDSIIDLTPLSNITTVTEAVVIGGNLQLTSLAPLSNIIEIGSFIHIKGNPLLKDLTGLNGLTKITGPAATEIFDNDSLVSLAGLNNVVELETTHLLIYNNPTLQSLEGLQGLNIISGIPAKLSIFNNSNLTNIDALQGLTSLGELNISNNPNLTNLGGVSNLTEVGVLSVDDMPLQNLQVFSNLNTVGKLRLQSNLLLEETSDLMNITSAESIIIDGCPLLQSLDGLHNISSLNELSISNNDNLISLDGLNINQLNDSNDFDLYIRSNAMLSEINALSSLSNLAAHVDVYISQNPALENLDGLSNLIFEGEGSVRILDNTELNDLCGLTTVTNLPTSVDYMVEGNAFNPSRIDIDMGNCNN